MNEMHLYKRVNSIDFTKYRNNRKYEKNVTKFLNFYCVIDLILRPIDESYFSKTINYMMMKVE